MMPEISISPKFKNKVKIVKEMTGTEKKQISKYIKKLGSMQTRNYHQGKS
jgi:hypothetical protein